MTRGEPECGDAVHVWEIPADGLLIDETHVQVRGEPWRVVIKLLPDHAHHVRIECAGHLVAEHVGALPEGWPGAVFPDEVQSAVEQVAERLSWS